MFLSFLTYRKIFTIALIVLLVVPCSVKREFKQWVQVETNQQVKPVKQLIACSVFYQLQKQDKQAKAEIQHLPALVSHVKPEYFAFAKTIQLVDFYNSQKEKIPTYILLDRFLI